MNKLPLDPHHRIASLHEVCMEWLTGEISGQAAFESLRELVEHYDFFISSHRTQIDEYINAYDFHLSDDLVFECFYLDTIILGGIEATQKLAAILMDDAVPRHDDPWLASILEWQEPHSLKAFRFSKRMARAKPILKARKASDKTTQELVEATIANVGFHNGSKKMSFDAAAVQALKSYKALHADINYRALSRRAQRWHKKGYR